MNHSSEDCSVPIPKFFRKSFQKLLLPGQKVEEIFDYVGGLDFDESGQLKLNDTVWGSKVMAVDKRQTKTLDMFFKKVLKTEESDSDISLEGGQNTLKTKNVSVTDNCSLNSNLTKCGEEEPNRWSEAAATPIKKGEKNKKLRGKTHSISASEDESPREKMKSSPSFSVDMFADENSTSLTSPKVRKTKIEVRHSLSEEESLISSQAEHDVGRFSIDSLNSIKNSLTQKVTRVLNVEAESCKSPKKQVQKKETLNDSNRQINHSRHDVSSSEDENKEETSSSPSKQQIQKKGTLNDSERQVNRLRHDVSSSEDQNKEETSSLPSKPEKTGNRMISIHEAFTGLSATTDHLSLQDLTEDDELYILQCPSEIDPKKLEGMEMTLAGNTTIMLENYKYDCTSIKGNLRRSLCVVLPDNISKNMKIGVYPLSGNIILSENLDIPDSEPIEGEFDYSHEDNILNEKTITEISKEHKKKKKRKSEKDSNSTTPVGIHGIGDLMGTAESNECTPSSHQKRKHKKSDAAEEEVSITIGLGNSFSEELLDTSVSKKKKKKHSKVKEEIDDAHLTTEEFNESVIDHLVSEKKIKSRASTGDVKCEPTAPEDYLEDATTEEKHSKKKNKKHKLSEATFNLGGDVTAPEEYFTKDVNHGLGDLFTKKKKKHKHITNEVDLDSFGYVKTEWEEPNIVSDYQEESPSKSKKRKRKEMEESFEGTDIEETIEKKKKKKHSYSES